MRWRSVSSSHVHRRVIQLVSLPRDFRPFTGNTYNRCIEDLWVREQYSLEFCRRDLVALVLDKLLAARDVSYLLLLLLLPPRLPPHPPPALPLLLLIPSSLIRATYKVKTRYVTFFRSTMKKYPSLKTPISPVRNQPSVVNDSLFAFSFLQYPFVTTGPRTQTSPDAPGSTSFSSSSTMRA